LTSAHEPPSDRSPPDSHPKAAAEESAPPGSLAHGGFGFAEDYDIERKFRETRLYQVAPISANLILSHLATHVLDLPKSF